MGLKAALLALALAVTSASYLASRQQPDGGFAEPGGHSYPELTAWSVLGLAAQGKTAGQKAQSYLVRWAPVDVSKIALRALALKATGMDIGPEVDALVPQPSGRIGPLVDSTIWAVLALHAAGQPAPAMSVRYLLRQQRASGGWSWLPRGAPDSNDTAAGIEALRASGVSGRPIRRGLAYLHGLERKDGGFPLLRGRASDSQSTAWAIQAYLAAGKKPPAAAFGFLARMRRPDGSYRYSKRYAVTPVWVTAQVLPALARKPFPLSP